jgi:mRNA interferase HigB
VTVLSKRRIPEFGKEHAEIDRELRAWFDLTSKAIWRDVADMRMNFADAGQVGRVSIFNIRRNAHRLIVKVDFRSRLVMVKDLFTHKQYDRRGWKKWC